MKKSYKRMKTIIGIGCISMVVVVGISIYMFFPKKATLSVYSEGQTISLEKEGIKTEEFKKYLAVASLLINEEYEDEYGFEEIENIRMLDTAISYVHSLGEENVELNEEGNYEYNADMITKIIQEIKGVNIDKNIPASTKYTYNEEKNKYVVSENNILPACEIIEIEEFNKRDNKIELLYTCYLGERETIYKIKAILVENSQYDYSPYFVNTIEKIKQ